jgi:hypothetical protein
VRSPRERLVHDLRHPLSLILLWEQIARLSDSADTRTQALDAIRTAALEQASILDRLARRMRSHPASDVLMVPRRARARNPRRRGRHSLPRG